ncbi:MAG TPA: glycosyltransferase family 4 protein [Intrasporangium sp.]|uniref:glycosyltransferase family 4 protein n=1 Tax=Intrasporangium sp. TaxID=1925024 RepID=UPI002D7919CA|nr:glycosyltransferase family 4 protein [Intrasporangium sp.]HET7399832.1 glycosyltransferase family 4 protein [Intrasporangium sp.]
MRILLLTHYYEPEVGAPQQRWGALVDHFVAAGHSVSVVAPAPHYPTGALLPGAEAMRPGRAHDGLHGERVHRVAFSPYAAGVGSRARDQAVAAADMVRTGSRVFRRHPPDVVVATVPSIPTLAAGAVLARRLRAPLVTEMRDAWPDLLAVAEDWDATAGRPGRSRPGSRLRPPVVRLTTVATTLLQRRSAAVVATTESFASALRTRGVHDVVVVRNGARPLPAATTAGPRPADGTLRVLYLGTVGRAQGLATAVRAAGVARRAGTAVVLRVVGDGAERDALRTLARAEGAPVEFVDPVPRDRVAEHYAWADTVLVSLRPWPALSLTVPSKLYEALSLGIHVSASLSGEAAELVTSTGGGDVAGAGDPAALALVWQRLAQDPARLRVGPGGTAWVAEHACDERLGARYLALLERVVAGRG